MGYQWWRETGKAVDGQDAHRFRAAAALAVYDPENPRWPTVIGSVTDDLVKVPSIHLAIWMDNFRPIREKLLPSLSSVFRNLSRTDVERSIATDILADYAADNPAVLSDLLMDASEIQFVTMFPKIKILQTQAIPIFTNELGKQSSNDANKVARETLAKRQANATVALLRLNVTEKVWPIFRFQTDSRTRCYLIDRMGRMGVNGSIIIDRLEREDDDSALRALLQSLGEFNFTPELRERIIPGIQKIYRQNPDAGIHAASEWLLRKWDQQAWLDRTCSTLAANNEPIQSKKSNQPRWHINTQGQTMITIPGPIEFAMGSPESEAERVANEKQYRVRIGRTFAISSHMVTNEQYRQFDKNFKPEHAAWTRLPNLPAPGIRWLDAAKYCNWLSEREGIPESQQCYKIEGEQIELKANYLSLTGYRLPTEAEFECAIRSGTTTSRFFGESVDLLPKYAWYFSNSKQMPWPVGSLKPNDFGFFDVYGNGITWCQESWSEQKYSDRSKVIDDKEDANLAVSRNQNRSNRGTIVESPVQYCRSAYRSQALPWLIMTHVGFRVARTIKAE